MKKLATMLLIAVFLASLIYLPNAASTTSRPALEDGDPAPFDGTPDLEGVVVSWAQPDTGNPWTVIVSDWATGEDYYQDFECVLSGVHCNIWIGLNETKWWNPAHTKYYADEKVDPGTGFDDISWYFAYPWSWKGYGRMLAGYRDIINGSQLEFVLNQFDTNIHQQCTTFFGGYNYRPGPLGDGKIQILIFNIRDELFYDIATAPGFIMGYYWYYASNINNANIIHIDTYQWWRRQGPNPPGTAPNVFPPYPLASRWPYQYESAIAHEFQHLIHRDNDFNELSWVNEGCSTLAEFICGYGHTSNLYNYMVWFWDTSLVIWEGNLENYGVVYLWTLYMYEHYGGQPIIWDVVHEQANGIQGWNIVLQAHGIKKNFDEIFQDWAIANYLDDTSFADGIYGYYNLDLPCKSSGWWDIPYSIAYWGAYDEVYPTGWILPERLPYIAWYWELYNGAPELKVYFDGDDYAGIFPHSPTHEWYSDGTPYSWFRLEQTFAIPSTGATLKFWSNYDIEEDWDYGYVEAHDLTTDEWYTLPGVNTISTIPHLQDNPNCPDDVEPTAYLAAGRWNAFTGSSGWYQETMDLSMFSGHNVELYFTYWTDPYTLGRGWYIDDIEIPELSFFDDVESGMNGWTVAGNWFITTGVIENDFKVNFIEAAHLEYRSTELDIYKISPMALDPVTEDGLENLKVYQTKTISTWGVLVAASQPGYEHSWYTEFYFIVDDAPFELIHYWLH